MRVNSPGLLLALPSKGNLHDRSIDFLHRCGLDLRRSGSGREYSARLSGADNVSVLFFRPEEIPARVEQGDAHAGITGEDLYREFGEGPPSSHLLMRTLGFGSARLVVAVPQSWIDVASVHDIEEVALIHRQTTGRSLRVATKFSRLTRAFFADHGVTDYQIVESFGATEGAPSAGLADLVVDLSSTGATLAQNHLKEIAGGTVLATEACLIASLRLHFWTPGALDSLDQLVEQVEARIRATSMVLVRFHLPPAQVERVRSTLVAEHRCSLRAVPDVAPPGRLLDVEVFCPRDRMRHVVAFLKSVGCSQIVVSNCEFLFDTSSRASGAFRQVLKRHEALAPARWEEEAR